MLLFLLLVYDPVALFKSGGLKTKYSDRNTDVIIVNSGGGEVIE